MSSIAIVILAHNDQESLTNLSENISRYCPDCVPFLYNSGTNPKLGEETGLQFIPNPQRLEYAHIMPFFLDVFEWFLSDRRQFTYLVNAETDMLFIRKGFGTFVEEAMAGYDYMAPLFKYGIPHSSKWRPYHSLKPELLSWKNLLEVEEFNQAFSPAQVFSRNYIEQLVTHPKYFLIKDLVKRNGSFTLQEVLNPTLVSFLKLQGRCYPEGLEPIIRYRPYQAVSGVKRALELQNAYLVHPVRRNQEDPARKMIINH